jgi:hypothetical protein
MKVSSARKFWRILVGIMGVMAIVIIWIIFPVLNAWFDDDKYRMIDSVGDYSLPDGGSVSVNNFSGDLEIEIVSRWGMIPAIGNKRTYHLKRDEWNLEGWKIYGRSPDELWLVLSGGEVTLMNLEGVYAGDKLPKAYAFSRVGRDSR